MRPATEEDLPVIVEIYNAAIATRRSTADTAPVSVESRRAWFKRHDVDSRPILVHEEGGEVAGWVSFEPFCGRPAYGHTAEISIYVAPRHMGMGLGRRLLQRSLERTPALGIKTVVAFIFAHNEPSLRLFRSAGFERWGFLPEVAVMEGDECSLCILGRRMDGRGVRECRNEGDRAWQLSRLVKDGE